MQLARGSIDAAEQQLAGAVGDARERAGKVAGEFLFHLGEGKRRENLSVPMGRPHRGLPGNPGGAIRGTAPGEPGIHGGPGAGEEKKHQAAHGPILPCLRIQDVRPKAAKAIAAAANASAPRAPWAQAGPATRPVSRKKRAVVRRILPSSTVPKAAASMPAVPLQLRSQA